MQRASSFITTVITRRHSSNSTPQQQLASLYYQGHGIEQNLPKAVELFTAAAQAGCPPSLAYGRQAAEAGSLSAQNEYSLLYAQGQGVELD